MNTLISFELARLLKEKGFDIPTQQHYEFALKSKKHKEDGYSGSFGWKKGELTLRSEYFINNHKTIDGTNTHWYFCSAPTISEVVMWLYAYHSIWIQTPFSHNDGKPFCWSINKTIRNISEEDEDRNCWLSGVDTEDINGWDSPTEAYEAAIEYTLNNLI